MTGTDEGRGVETVRRGRRVGRARVVEQAPAYPVQLILGVFDLPDEHRDPAVTPELVVRRVRGWAPRG